MDATRLAATLLEPIPANRIFGMKVLRAVDGGGEVSLVVTERTTNVIGSLHASGLIALIDAAGLAAVIAAAQDEDQLRGLTPLGTTAQLEFLAPARGRLIARCLLQGTDLTLARALLSGRRSGGQLETTATVLDATKTLVCRGTFTWKLPSAGRLGEGSPIE